MYEDTDKKKTFDEKKKKKKQGNLHLFGYATQELVSLTELQLIFHMTRVIFCVPLSLKVRKYVDTAYTSAPTIPLGMFGTRTFGQKIFTFPATCISEWIISENQSGHFCVPCKINHQVHFHLTKT